MGVQNARRVIVDTLLYQPTLEKAFHHMADYLSLVGKNGIILNPSKFVFGAEEVHKGEGGPHSRSRGRHCQVPQADEPDRHEVLLAVGVTGGTIL